MIDNATIYYPLTISSDDTITLDLAGYNLSTTKTITNNGTFTITDSVANGFLTELAAVNMISNNSILNVSKIGINNTITTNDIIINSADSNLVVEDVSINSLSGIYNNGNITTNNSNIATTKDDVIDNRGTLIVEGGKYNTTKSYTSIYNSSSNKLNINDATLSGGTSLYNSTTTESKIKNSVLSGIVENRNDSNITIESSTINGYLSNYSRQNVSISNNSIINKTGYTYGVYNYLTGNVEINDTEINSEEVGKSYYDYGLYNNSTGTINSNNLTINLANIDYDYNKPVYGLYNSSTGTVNLTNFNMTTIDNTNTWTIKGIYNNSTGTINLNNGNVSMTGGKETIGLYSQTANGNINFLSGNISVINTATSYGAYINNGNITLGTKDEKVDITTPTIKAVGTTGIGAKKVNGYLKFYDGKITGSTSAKPETTTEVEYGYEVHNYTDENGYDYCILEYME